MVKVTLPNPHLPVPYMEPRGRSLVDILATGSNRFEIYIYIGNWKMRGILTCYKNKKQLSAAMLGNRKITRFEIAKRFCCYMAFSTKTEIRRT